MRRKVCVINTQTNPSEEWAKVARRVAQTGKYRAKDICEVLGDPVGGVVVAPEPDKETTYRLAGYGH